MTVVRSHRLAATAAALCLLTSLSACGGDVPEPHPPGAVALVVGGRNNMPRPQLLTRARDLLRDSYLSRDTVFIVSVSGRPEVLYTEPVPRECDSTVACDAAVEGYLGKLDRLLGAVKAKTEEADTLGAILLAARQVNGAQKPGPKQIIVIDSGLQTTGDLFLQAPGALSVDPKVQSAQLMKDDGLKDLKDINILLTGIGSNAAPQNPLPPASLSKLDALWATVLSDAGAKVDRDTTVLGGPLPEPGLPQVAVVDVSPPKPPPPGRVCFRLREDQVGFLPDKAVFRDPAAANDVLGPIAQALKDAHVAATIIGTTALPEEPTHTLSNARAAKVKSVLVEMGVPASLLTPIGVGTEFGDFKPDTDANGDLIETLAVQNRLVIIQPVGRPCAA